MLKYLEYLDASKSQECVSDPTNTVSSSWVATREAIHIVYSAARRDPQTGICLPRPLTETLNDISLALKQGNPKVFNDRVYQICLLCQEPLKKIIQSLRSNIRRNYSMQLISQAKEIDGKSIEWISRIPGRNIREKLSGKSHILAVKRELSVDTHENRILKSFSSLLMGYIEERLDLVDEPDQLKGSDKDRYNVLKHTLDLIDRFQHNDAYPLIGRQNHSMPNNVLLSDKYYSRIWRCWKWLLAYNDELDQFALEVNKLVQSSVLWSISAMIYAKTDMRVPEQPCYLIEGTDGFGFSTFRFTQNEFKGYNDLLPATVASIDFEQKSITANILKVDGLEDVTLNRSVQSLDKLSIGDTIWVRKNEQAPNGYDVSGMLDNKVHITTHEDTLDIQVFGSVKKIYIRRDRWGMYFIQDITSEDSSIAQGFPSIHDVCCHIFKILSIPILDNPATKQDKIFKSPIIGLDLIEPQLRLAIKGQEISLDKRLLTQKWIGKEDTIWIDLDEQKCIDIGSDLLLFGMQDVLYQPEQSLIGEYKLAADRIAGLISASVECNYLGYAYPDIVDEFGLTTIRSSLGLAIKNALPIPRSICSVLSWQYSSTFISTSIKPNDNVIVIDGSNKSVSITRLVARFDRKVQNYQPDSKGLYWERHPSIEYQDLLPDFDTDSEHCATLISNRGKFAEIDGECEAFIDEAGGYVSSLKGKEQGSIIEGREYSDIINTYIRERPLGANKQTFIIIIDKRLTSESYRHIGIGIRARNTILVDHQMDIASGAYRYVNRAIKKKLSTWVEFMPELSIEVVKNGIYDLLYLVKDKVIKPVYGEPQNLEIDEPFMLPAGYDDYHFPVYVGNGSLQPTRYEAVLKSPVFPLKTDLQVSLKLVYNYAAEETYDLQFIPDVPISGAPIFKPLWEKIYLADKIESQEIAFNRKAFYTKPLTEEEKSALYNFAEEFARICDRNLSNTYNYKEGAIRYILYGFIDKDTGVPHYGLTRLSFLMMRLTKYGTKEDIETIHNQFLRYRVYEFLGDLTGIQRSNLIKDEILNIDLVKDLSSQALVFLSSFGKSTFSSVKTYICSRISDDYSKISFIDIICLGHLAGDNLEDESVRSKFEFLIENYRNVISGNQYIYKEFLRQLDNVVWYEPFNMECLAKHKKTIATMAMEMLKYMYGRLVLNRSHVLQYYENPDPAKRDRSLANAYRIGCELLLASLYMGSSENEKDYILFSSSEMGEAAYLIRRLDKAMLDNGIKRESRINFSLDKPKALQNMSSLGYVLNCFLTGSKESANIEIREVESEF